MADGEDDPPDRLAIAPRPLFAENAEAGPSRPRRAAATVAATVLQEGIDAVGAREPWDTPSPSPSPPPSPKRRKIDHKPTSFHSIRQRGHSVQGYNWYYGDLKRHLTETRVHFAGGDDVRLGRRELGKKTGYRSSYVFPSMARWSSTEKGRFFAALARHSRLRPDLVAADIGTKSELDVVEYMHLLEMGSQSLTDRKGLFAEAPQWWTRFLGSGACEVPDAWVGQEDKLADAVRSVEATREVPPMRTKRLRQRRGEPHPKRDVVEMWGRRISLTQMDTLADALYACETGAGTPGDPDAADTNEDKVDPIEADNETIALLQDIPKRERTPEERSRLQALMNRRRMRQTYRRKKLLASGLTDADIERGGGPDAVFKTSVVGGRKRKGRGAQLAETHPAVAELIDLGVPAYLTDRGWEVFNYGRMAELIGLYQQGYAAEPADDASKAGISFVLLATITAALHNYLRQLVRNVELIASQRRQDAEGEGVTEDDVDAALQLQGAPDPFISLVDAVKGWQRLGRDIDEGIRAPLLGAPESQDTMEGNAEAILASDGKPGTKATSKPVDADGDTAVGESDTGDRNEPQIDPALLDSDGPQIDPELLGLEAPQTDPQLLESEGPQIEPELLNSSEDDDDGSIYQPRESSVAPSSPFRASDASDAEADEPVGNNSSPRGRRHAFGRRPRYYDRAASPLPTWTMYTPVLASTDEGPANGLLIKPSVTDDEDEKLDAALEKADAALELVVNRQLEGAVAENRRAVDVDPLAWLEFRGVRGRGWAKKRANPPVPVFMQAQLARAQKRYATLMGDVLAARRQRRLMRERSVRFPRWTETRAAAHRRRSGRPLEEVEVDELDSDSSLEEEEGVDPEMHLQRMPPSHSDEEDDGYASIWSRALSPESERDGYEASDAGDEMDSDIDVRVEPENVLADGAWVGTPTAAPQLVHDPPMFWPYPGLSEVLGGDDALDSDDDGVRPPVLVFGEPKRPVVAVQRNQSREPSLSPVLGGDDALDSDNDVEGYYKPAFSALPANSNPASGVEEPSAHEPGARPFLGGDDALDSDDDTGGFAYSAVAQPNGDNKGTSAANADRYDAYQSQPAANEVSKAVASLSSAHDREAGNAAPVDNNDLDRTDRHIRFSSDDAAGPQHPDPHHIRFSSEERGAQFELRGDVEYEADLGMQDGPVATFGPDAAIPHHPSTPQYDAHPREGTAYPDVIVSPLRLLGGDDALDSD